MAQQWIEGKVAGNRKWREGLHSLQVRADFAPFQAGQFTKLGLEIDGEVIARPYSLVNAPGDALLDFHFSVVPGGPLSARLAALAAGEAVLVMPRANGFLVLDEVPEGRELWLIATGTGIGPFLSILRSEAAWQRFREVVLVHAVRTGADRSYREVIADVTAARGTRFRFVEFVSRETVPGAMSGRIPAALADGSLQRRAGVALDPASSRLMLCGNPAMVDDVTATLQAREFRKHRRREPGHIIVETYW